MRCINNTWTVGIINIPFFIAVSIFGKESLSGSHVELTVTNTKEENPLSAVLIPDNGVSEKIDAMNNVINLQICFITLWIIPRFFRLDILLSKVKKIN